MPRRLRWWRAAVRALLVLALVGSVAGWALLRVYGPRITRERVETEMAAALGEPVHVGSVHLRPWLARLSLVDVAVGDGPGSAGLVIRVPRVDVSLGIESLWRRQLVLSIALSEPDVTVEGAAGEASRVDLFPFPDSFALGPVRLRIGALSASGGHLAFRQADSALAIEARGADIVARPAAGDLDVSARLTSLRLDALGRQEQIDHVAADARISADRLLVRRSSWRWESHEMRIEGEVRHPWSRTRELGLRVTGDLPLAALARRAHVGGGLQGTAHVVADLTGAVAAPRVAGRVSVPELGIGGAILRDALIDARWAAGTLRADLIEVRLGRGRVIGRATASSVSSAGADVQVELRELTLPAALSHLGPGRAIVEATVRGGTVELSRAAATWRDVTLGVDGRIDMTGPIGARVRLAADLRGLGDALGLGALAGRAAVTADVSGTLAAPVVTGRAHVADGAAAGRALEPIEASFRFASAAGAEAPSLARWHGTVESPRVAWPGANVESLAATLAVDADRVELVRARARAAAVPVDMSGTWNWSGSGRARATLGPAALGAVTGAPPALRLGGTGRGQVDLAFERGVAAASATVRVEQASVAGVSLGDGTIGLRTRGAALTADAAFPARRLRAEARGRLEAGAAIAAHLEIDELGLRGLLAELGLGAADSVDGRLSGRGELSIPFSRPADGSGVLAVRPAGLRLFAEPWQSPAPIVIRWQSGRLVLEKMRLDGPAGTLGASGILAGGDAVELAVALDNARLPGALAGVGRGAARSDLRIAAGQVEVTRFDGHWPGLTARASGRIRADGAIELDARVDAEADRLSALAGLPGIAGRATLIAQVRGRPDALEASGHLRAPAAQVLGAAISEVEVPFRLAGNALRVRGAGARLGAGRIAADGEAVWAGGGPLTRDALARDLRVTADVRAPALRLEDLAPLLPAPARGRGELAVTARVQGPARAWRGSGTLASARLDLPSGPLRGLHASLGFDDRHVEVTELRVDALGMPVRATATWAWTGGGTASATLGPAPLADLALLPPRLAARGTARARLDVTMRSPADLTGSARADLDQVAIAGVALGRGQVDVSVRERSMRAQLEFPERRLKATASGPLEAAGVVTAEAALSELALAPLIRELLPGAAGIDGSLSARATARVPLTDPRRGEGVLSIEPVRLVAPGQTWDGRGPVEVRWAQGGLRLARLNLAGGEGEITGAGTLGPDGALDVRARARLPLAMLPAMRPEVREAGGHLDLSLRVSGTASAPALAGDGAVHEGKLLLRNRAETVRDLEARLSLSGQRIELREASAAVGGGRVQARGEASVAGGRIGAYRLRLAAQNVALATVPGLASAWDADLELSGIAGDARLQGEARLVRGVYSRDFSLLSLLTSPPEAAAEPGAALRLLVRARLDDNLRVRNRAAELRAGGVVSIEGTAARPILFGSIESRDGRIGFRGHEWNVVTAAVRFADPRWIDPFLDIAATSRIREYDVTVQITGRASDLTVRLSSSPRLAQDDLVALVSLGATRAELKDSPGSVLAAEAGKALAQNLLGLSPAAASGLRVSTTTGSTAASEVHGPFEDRGPASSPRTTPGDRKERVRIEYQMLERLFLSGEYDLEGGYGADVVFRFRFR